MKLIEGVSNMKTCAKCQAELKEGDRFCGNCGAPVEGVTDTAEQGSKVESETTNVVKASKIDSEKMKKDAKQYWDFFVSILKRPGEMVESTPKNYGFITLGINTLSSFFIALAMYIYVQLTVIYSIYVGGGTTVGSDGAYFGGMVFRVLLTVVVIHIVLLAVVYMLEKFLFLRKVSFMSVVNHYANYLAVPTVLSVLLGVLCLPRLLPADIIQLSVIAVGLVYLIIPATLILAGNNSEQGRKISPFYQLVITYLSIAFCTFIVMRIFFP